MDYTVPDKEMPADIYAKDDNATNILTYMQNTNHFLANPITADAPLKSVMSMPTGGQHLNMGDR
jgi:hypothetical protein